MADRSRIEWTDATWNPVRARNRATGGVGHFCEHVSEGCRHCYAERLQPRFGNPVRYARQDRDHVELFLDEETLLAPLRWKRQRMIFVCSMTDLFGEWVADEWLDKLFAVAALARQHTFQVLTKRAARMRGYLSQSRAHPVGLEALGLALDEHGRNARSTVGAGCILQGDVCHLRDWPLSNVWLGVSVEDQTTAVERIPDLLATPAAVRWVSYEPALGPVDFAAALAVAALAERGCNGRRIDWLVCGGESGPNARPMHPAWARSARDQCAAAGVPFFFKQWGEWAPVETIVGLEEAANLELRNQYCRLGEVDFVRFGKRAAGRALDGAEHNAMPEARQ